MDGVNDVTINVAHKVASHAVQKGVNMIPGVKNIIAVASGKGCLLYTSDAADESSSV